MSGAAVKASDELSTVLLCLVAGLVIGLCWANAAYDGITPALIKTAEEKCAASGGLAILHDPGISDDDRVHARCADGTIITAKAAP